MERETRAATPNLDLATGGSGEGMGADMDAIGIFLRECRRRDLRPRTLEKWRNILEDFSRVMLAKDRGILNADREDIESWLDSKANGQLAAKSRAAYITCLRSFYRCMAAEQIRLDDPTLKLAKPKLRPGLPRPIPRDDLMEALRWAGPRERCLLTLGAYAGLRCCEIAGLDAQDINWAERTIFIKGETSKGGHERVVPMHPEIEAALKRFGVPKQGPFFFGRNGRRYTAERVSHLGNDYLRSAGFTATMHQLRHRFGTDVCRAAGVRTAQQLLGHADLKTTATYTDVTVDDLRAAVAGLVPST